MYKIMLADDEGIVIESLKFIIEKEFKDECIIESAKTGRGVIELAEAIRPDIAIMDIQMPGINGIEAIRHIKERNPHIIFIIMTAYDKFSYAKEAVNLGVFEYLNKPIERSVIIRVLRDAMRNIDADKERISRELIIREKMESVLPIIENGLIYDILFQENFTEDIDNFKNLLEINNDYGYMAVLVSGDDEENRHLTNAVGASVRLQKEYAHIREILKEHMNCCVGSAMGNKLVVFVPYEADSMKYEDRIELIDSMREMVRIIRRECDGQFRLGIGGVRHLRELTLSYNEALDALTYADGSVVHADDAPVKVKYEEDYPADLERALFNAVDKIDADEAIGNANKFFDWMENTYPEDIDDIKLKVIEFVLWAEHIVYEQGGTVYKFRSRSNYLSDVLGLKDLSSIRSWFVSKISDSVYTAKTQKAENSDNIVDKAKRYIEEKYADKDMSLDEVSRLVDVSPYYFSKIFKEETGENFIEYLTRIRIDRAKDLLNSSSLSMKEICSEIGYADPNYFSRAFKKNVGVTPTEYKEGIKA